MCDDKLDHRHSNASLDTTQSRKRKHQQPKEYRVFVGNLPFSWSEDAVRNIFHSYGTVVDVEVPRRKQQSEMNRGFAFVYFSNREEALAATTLSGSRLDGRIIRVELGDDDLQEKDVAGRDKLQGVTNPMVSSSSQVYEWGGKQLQKQQNELNVPKEGPNFQPSGALYKEQKMTRYGKELKFVEPLDARKPDKHWRLYVFKNGQLLEGKESVFYIYQKSSYLFGRDRDIVDIPIDHPSASKQHAVLQFRQVVPKNSDKLVIKPYIMDLESTNGTFLNNEPIESLRYYELLEKDLLRFGHSSREFILLTDNCSMMK